MRDNIKRLTKQILIEPNVKEGYVKIEVMMPTPDLSAQMVDIVKLLRKDLSNTKFNMLNSNMNLLKAS